MKLVLATTIAVLLMTGAAYADATTCKSQQEVDTPNGVVTVTIEGACDAVGAYGSLTAEEVEAVLALQDGMMTKMLEFLDGLAKVAQQK